MNCSNRSKVPRSHRTTNTTYSVVPWMTSIPSSHTGSFNASSINETERMVAQCVQHVPAHLPFCENYQPRVWPRHSQPPQQRHAFRACRPRACDDQIESFLCRQLQCRCVILRIAYLPHGRVKQLLQLLVHLI